MFPSRNRVSFNAKETLPVFPSRNRVSFNAKETLPVFPSPPEAAEPRGRAAAGVPTKGREKGALKPGGGARGGEDASVSRGLPGWGPSRRGPRRDETPRAGRPVCPSQRI